MAGGGVEVLFRSLLTSSLDGGEWSASRPGRCTSKESATGIHQAGWAARVLPDDLEMRKVSFFLPLIEFEPQIVQPVS